MLLEYVLAVVLRLAVLALEWSKRIKKLVRNYFSFMKICLRFEAKEGRVQKYDNFEIRSNRSNLLIKPNVPKIEGK